MISVVVPCFNEAEALPYFVREMRSVMERLRQADGTETEIIFVDDGSRDKTLEYLREICREEPRFRYLSFSRNFGKESAMYAGMQHAKGEYVCIMDADMQDPPALLPEMAAVLKTGEYDSVATRRVTRRGEPPIRNFFARCFYKLIHRISEADIVDGARDFRLMNRAMVDAVLSMGEYNRFSKGIFGWVGFRTKWLPYENVERVAGETKWSFWKLLKYSLQGIIGFSTMPLSIASFAGLLAFLAAFVMIVVIIIKKLIFGDPVSGWPSMACIILFVGGMQLFCTGILGQYLAKTYLETKRRPIYILRESSDGRTED